MALDRTLYQKLPTEELKRRWDRLEADTSAYTMEAELGRMFALQEIHAVLEERGELRAALADQVSV